MNVYADVAKSRVHEVFPTATASRINMPYVGERWVIRVPGVTWSLGSGQTEDEAWVNAAR